MSEPNGHRARKKAALRLSFVRAAVELFGEHGFEATTVDQIAARAGSSSSTFFRYFGTKEGVVFGDAEDRLHALKATLEAERGADPITVASTALAEELESFSIFDDPALERACLALWHSEPGPQRRYIEIIRQWEDAITDHLAAEWQVEPTEPRCRITALALAAVVRASLETPNTRENARAIAEDGFALLTDGIAPPRLAAGHQTNADAAPAN